MRVGVIFGSVAIKKQAIVPHSAKFATCRFSWADSPSRIVHRWSEIARPPDGA